MLSPRGQSGLEAKILVSASASNIWPRHSLDLVVLLCNQVFSGKNRVKFRNCFNFSGIILNRMLLIIIWYFFTIILGLGLGLNLKKLASAS